MLRKIINGLREKLFDRVDMQVLLDRQNIQMSKTKEYIASDRTGHNDARLKATTEDSPSLAPLPIGEHRTLAWSYRFKFDNQARQRKFLDAISKYPPQQWDKYVYWKRDISNFNGEITVEAEILVPEAEAGRFRHTFETFVTKNLILEK